MTIEEYGNLVENAFKIKNWNYSRGDSEDKIKFIINLI